MKFILLTLSIIFIAFINNAYGLIACVDPQSGGCECTADCPICKMSSLSSKCYENPSKEYIECCTFPKPKTTLAIPTLSEWGLIIFTLLLLTTGTLFSIQRSQLMTRAAVNERTGGLPPLILVPVVFIKALTLTGLLTLAVFTFDARLSYRLFNTVDVIGTLISAPVFAYLLHLLMLFKRP